MAKKKNGATPAPKNGRKKKFPWEGLKKGETRETHEGVYTGNGSGVSFTPHQKPKNGHAAKPEEAEDLMDVRADQNICRVCGCTDDDCSQCIEKIGEPCVWVDPELCSACVAEAAERCEDCDEVIKDGEQVVWADGIVTHRGECPTPAAPPTQQGRGRVQKELPGMESPGIPELDELVQRQFAVEKRRDKAAKDFAAELETIDANIQVELDARKLDHYDFVDGPLMRRVAWESKRKLKYATLTAPPKGPKKEKRLGGDQKKKRRAAPAGAQA